MRLETWTPAFLPALLRYWNRAFAGKRNFRPLDERLFRERVLGRRGIVLAVEGGEVVGMLHARVRPEAEVRGPDPDWPGGPQGLIAFLHVEPSWRRRGIGDALWHRGLERLRRTRQVALGSFYGSREEPRTPLWGTPAGPAVEWDDSATKKFLARKGFAPRFRALHLAVELAGRTDDFRRAAARSRRSGAELRASAGRVEAVRRGRTAGAVVYFAMPELGPGRCAIHEASVAEAWRAKALPGQLLEGALGRMREEGAANCEALAAPDVDPRGFRLYSKAGFRTVASWAIY